MVKESKARNKLISFTLAHRNRARMYSLCRRWKDSLTGQNPLLNGKFFTLEGELIWDRGHIVEINVGVFSLPVPVALFPTAAVINDVLARDTALDTMAGPYTAGEPNTKRVKTRKICPVPHPLEGLGLLGEDGITWQ